MILDRSQKIEDIRKSMEDYGYISDPQISMTIFLARILGKPILLEGPAGVGKTEIAKILAKIDQAKLIRLQCYEGLDVNHAIYEWNYQRQLLYLKMAEKDNKSIEEKEANIFSMDYILHRPLLEAILREDPTVLLIDEIDRSDEEFESYFLELLSDWQISIPELGTIEARNRPAVVITSNRTRELSEALRRRCLYLWIDYPDLEKEVLILKTKLPAINEQLAESIGKFMQELRQRKLEKVPGVAESLDWAMALTEMHLDHLDKSVVQSTLGVILKDWKDVRDTQNSLTELFDKVGISSRIS